MSMMFHECDNECDDTDGHFHIVGYCFNCGMRVTLNEKYFSIDDGGNKNCPPPYVSQHRAVISS